MNLEPPKCATCRFFLPAERPECRAHPPQTSFVAVPQQTLQGPAIGIQQISSFPHTQLEHWCGEWAAKFSSMS
jgi:hypothetical protein